MRNFRLALIAGAMVLATTATAAAALFYVYGPATWPNGKPYAVHAADWWKWAVAQPASVSPLLDETGENCAQGQSGLTWYLAGTFSGESVTRTCKVPVGRTLVFPVINSAYFAFPSDPAEQKTEEFLRAQVEGVADATNLSVTIDGVAVRDVRRFLVDSVVFSARLPVDNVFGTDELVLSPAVDRGFYLAVAPMLPGKHTIKFHGELDGYVQDVTYKLTVAGF